MFVFALIYFAFAQQCSNEVPPPPCPDQLSAVSTGAFPNNVYISGYLTQMSDLNIDLQTIQITMYFWIRWSVGARDEENTTAPFRPDTTLEIINSIKQVDTFTLDLYGLLCDAVAGYAYRVWKVETTYIQNFDYSLYPLDEHDIRIQFEDSVNPTSVLVFFPDDLDQNLNSDDDGDDSLTNYGDKPDDDLFLPGWNFGEFRIEVIEKIYQTNFGEASSSVSSGENTYSQANFVMRIARSKSIFAIRTFPPILITLLIAGLVMLLDVEALNTRLAVNVSALLTEVFLQIDAKQGIPSNVDYLTLVDWLFLFTYIELFLIIIECILIRRIYYRMKLNEKKRFEQQEDFEAREQERKIGARVKRNKKRNSEELMMSALSTESGRSLRTKEDRFFIAFLVFTVVCFVVISLYGITSQT